MTAPPRPQFQPPPAIRQPVGNKLVDALVPTAHVFTATNPKALTDFVDNTLSSQFNLRITSLRHISKVLGVIAFPLAMASMEKNAQLYREGKIGERRWAVRMVGDLIPFAGPFTVAGEWGYDLYDDPSPINALTELKEIWSGINVVPGSFYLGKPPGTGWSSPWTHWSSLPNR